MTNSSKSTSLKEAKVVNRASIQFHKKSYANSQQVNSCPLDFALLVKWVNNFQSMQDCTAENS